MLLYFI